MVTGKRVFVSISENSQLDVARGSAMLAEIGSNISKYGSGGFQEIYDRVIKDRNPELREITLERVREEDIKILQNKRKLVKEMADIQRRFRTEMNLSTEQ